MKSAVTVLYSLCTFSKTGKLNSALRNLQLHGMPRKAMLHFIPGSPYGTLGNPILQLCNKTANPVSTHKHVVQSRLTLPVSSSHHPRRLRWAWPAGLSAPDPLLAEVGVEPAGAGGRVAAVGVEWG